MVSGSSIPFGHKRGPDNGLSHIYRDLASWLDFVERSATSTDDIRIRACFAVLEEDLQALMTECEDYLLAERYSPPRSVQSLQTRSMTVIEEVRTLLGH